LRLDGRFLSSISEPIEIHGILLRDSKTFREDSCAAVSLQINGVEVALLLIAT
jgi:hypothetical protein